jgi:hypothetical protein
MPTTLDLKLRKGVLFEPDSVIPFHFKVDTNGNRALPIAHCPLPMLISPESRAN